MAITREQLMEKGWTEEEITKTLQMAHGEGKEEKHIEYKKEMNKTVYWATLLVLTVSNFLISIVLIPFLLVMQPLQLSVIVIVLGLIFGLMFNLVILDIEHIKNHHHLLAAVFIPGIALVNVFVMVSIANGFGDRIGLESHENPMLISIIYIAAFLLPYIYSQFREASKRWKRIEQSSRQSRS
ncbi:hypothetical protein GF345_02205 [Candidatus Woesearchaeota archaeon]|nr:hypothetical protein [Candidatus Woesearchaeota archaeon]